LEILFTVGLNATTPQAKAGKRREPATSDPIAQLTNPNFTKHESPPLEPPAIHSKS